ncbi:kinesin-like protein KIF6 [Stigmatopora nigra]
MAPRGRHARRRPVNGEEDPPLGHIWHWSKAQVYSVNNEEPTSALLEFVVPKEVADGFVNNKRECFSFRFQRVFDQESQQEEIFEDIAKPVAESVLAGYNGTIFAYGQTGSGKTFTITGGPERYDHRGIIPRTLSYLYESLSQDGGTVHSTHISYLEIYNETGYDLLDSGNQASQLEDLPKVMIMEDSEQNIHLRNLSLQPSANEEEALNLLFLGDTNRMIAETPSNHASTRSHCIFTVHLCRRQAGSATWVRSKLHLVDLAGSDRVGKSGLDGHLLTEAKYINLSLHYLEQVIIALSERNRSHIPYRNSMLTSVLRDSLGGNCKTTMIATLAVDKRNLDESVSTCRFAQRVAVIKNEAILNEEVDPALLIARLKQEVESLKEELTMLTGEQREERLSAEESRTLEESVENFVADPDPDVTLNLGADLRKIHYCFRLLKMMFLANTSGKWRNRDLRESTAASATPEERVIRERRLEEEVHQLKPLLLLRRDGEIGAALSTGKQRAFDNFVKQHGDCGAIEDNKCRLKHSSAEARKLGEELHRVREKINEWKKRLELRRRQRAARAVGENERDVADEADPVEEGLRVEIQQAKISYKSTAGRLKALRTEIEHLQLLLERAKVKLRRDFQRRCHPREEEDEEEEEEEGCSNSQSPIPATLPPSSQCTPGFESQSTPEDQEAQFTSSSSSEWRALSKCSLAPSSIPMTGDRQADADILAFVRARQNLLGRAGALHK